MTEQSNSETAPEGEATGKSVSVFISYAHESDVHRRRVYGLAASLRRDELNVLIDIEKDTEEDWPLWMQRQIEMADYILCVCTKEYRDRFDHKSNPNVGLGVGWEGGLIRKLVYDSKLENSRIFPFCFNDDDQKFIPLTINGCDRFVVPIPDQNCGYESLLRKLWKQPLYTISPQPISPKTTLLKTEIIEPLYPPPNTIEPSKSPENTSPVLTAKADNLASASTAAEGADEPKFNPDELSKAYQQTSNDINQLIAQNEKLRDFLQRSCPNALAVSGPVRIVSSGLQKGEIKVYDVLKGIRDNLKTYSGTQADWEQLQTVIGGFLVFAVDAEWVLKQRLAATNGGARYPGGPDARQTIPIGLNREANLLPLLTAAFAGGFASLGRIFGKIESLEHNRELNTSPPVVGKGPHADDKLTELKQHFIKCVFGPTVACGNPRDIEANIENVRQKLTDFAEQRDPYYVSNEQYRDLEQVLKNDLKLKDLLMMFSDHDGVLEHVVNEKSKRVALLSRAWEIFDEISRHLK